MSSYLKPTEILPIFNIENYLYGNENITLSEANKLYYGKSISLNINNDGRLIQSKNDWGGGINIANGAICTKSNAHSSWCLERGTNSNDASINFYTAGLLTYRLGLNTSPFGTASGVFSIFGPANSRIMFIDTNGNMTINGTYNTVSDQNMKKDILENDLGLGFIEKLKTKKYKLKSDENSKYRYGLIWQDLQQTLEENNISFNGLYNSENSKSISYIELIAPMIKAIQELTERIHLIEKQLNNLESSFSMNS